MKPLFWIISESDLSKAVLRAKGMPNKVHDAIVAALKKKKEKK